jgi:dihydrodipicolinate synthase/N-acetylneuraminate lyase
MDEELSSREDGLTERVAKNVNPILEGVVVPAITPVDANDCVDEKTFRKMLRRLIEAGVHGIFVGGSAGEGPLLVDREWHRMVSIARDEVDGRIPLLGGVMDTSSARVCAKVRALRDYEYRHFVVTPSYYTTLNSQSEHLRLFGAAREAAGEMNMVVYNIPSCTASVIAVDTLCDMARRGWIRYCKESSSDLKYTLDLIKRGGEAGLGVLAGEEPHMDRTMLAGAKGVVPVCANYDPGLYIRVYEAGLRRDRKALAILMPRLLLVRETTLRSGASWIAGMKYTLSVLGLCSGKPVSPLEPAEPKRRAAIDAMILADENAGIPDWRRP